MKAPQHEPLLKTVLSRFEGHPGRHEGLSWVDVAARLQGDAAALVALQSMEKTGGEPDVVVFDKASRDWLFCDCAAESPSGRRSVCYDRQGLDSRKEFKPQNNAVDMAAELGIELLSEAQYRALQTLGEFDLKSSSWVKTPAALRSLGGALFCDRRYGQVFTYHNGAQSYYAARGFRGTLSV